MKKLKLIITTIFMVMIAIVLSSSVYAGTVNDINATKNGGKITVSGTVDSSVYAVAVVVYSGSDLVYMQTGNVNGDGSYNVELEREFTNGVYEVRVADYNGGEYKTTSVEIKEEDAQNDEELNTITEDATEAKSSNPKTGDYIMIALAIFGLGTIGTIVTTKINKKSKVSKH